jgi:hypothetical protein
MRIIFRRAIACALGTAMLAGAAHAEEPGSAEKLRRLDIMLMVTGLRCRGGEDNFQADFHAFEAQHLAELNGAARTLQAQLATRLGEKGAARELDRMGVTMANQYGGGHPWLGCHELKQVTRDLAIAVGPDPLVAAADELLRGDGPQLAYRGL